MIIKNRKLLENIIRELKQQDSKIVFTNGCFDILHVGHVKYLNEAKKLGDFLIVGVNSDESIKRLKGHDRPINCLEDRMYILNNLKCVDLVVPFDEDDPRELIKIIKPHYHVKGSDYKNKPLIERETIEKFGGKVVFVDLVEGKSTTKTIKKIKGIQ
jgi:rfaE bifunctional protein nucleotidyltransferase chain/domain